MKLSQLALKLHGYIGIFLGVLIIIISITGSFLVFHKEINQALNSQLFHIVPQGDRISPDAALKTVRDAYPQLTPSYIDLPRKPDAVYQVGLRSKDDKWTYAYINPYTGTLLGTQEWGRSLTTFIYDIHITLLSGEMGGKVVGICGISLLLLSITGLILWPGWKKLRPGFRIRWQAPARLVNYDIHKVSGIVSVAFILLIAITGTGMIFWTQVEPTLYWLTRTPQPPTLKSTVIPGKPPLTLVAVLEKANSALPGAETTFISLPSQPDGVFRVTKKFPQEISPEGVSRVFIDAYSGKVLRVENALTAPLASRILNSLFPLHIGSYGGLPTRIVYLFLGLIPPVLSLTGFVLWRQRQWDKARRQEAIRLSQKVTTPPEEPYFWVNEWPWF